jgi:hypothetical protein
MNTGEWQRHKAECEGTRPFSRLPAAVRKEVERLRALPAGCEGERATFVTEPHGILWSVERDTDDLDTDEIRVCMLVYEERRCQQ